MKRLGGLASELARRNLRQEDVARHLGVDRSRVSRIICCEVRPRPREKWLIAQLVALPIRKLFPRRWRLRSHERRLGVNNRRQLRRIKK